MDLLKSLKWRLAGRKKFPALVRRFGGWFLLDPENWVDKHVLADDLFSRTELGIASPFSLSLSAAKKASRRSISRRKIPAPRGST